MNQQTRIDALFALLRSETLSDPVAAIVLIDYKMKFESIRYSEKTVEFFGKRGSSWHCAVFFFSDGHGGVNNLFYDQISSGDAKKMFFAVASICDAIFRRLSLDLPTVRNVHVLSDNAKCYQNNVLPVILHFIVASHGSLRLSPFVHTETQDGRSLVDAHFAIAMKYINSFVCNYGQNVTKQLVCALNSNEGLGKNVAELVSIQRAHSALKHWSDLKEDESSFCRLGRINEFLYNEEINDNDDSFIVKAYELSGFTFQQYIFSRSGSVPFSESARSSECPAHGNADVDLGDDVANPPLEL